MTEANHSGPAVTRARAFAGPALFVGLRLALLMALPVESLFQYGDFAHHYNLALWSIPGHCPVGPNACYPLLDYWYEYPPVFGFLSILLLKITGGGGAPPFHTYAYALALVIVCFDAGIFILVRRLAARLYPAATAEWIGWAYALMPAPLILSWWAFDSLTGFWLLLGLWALVEGRDGLSATATGIGIMTKLLPGLLLPAVWFSRRPRRAAGLTVGALAISALILLPFVIRAPAVTAASLQSQYTKSSSATIWALIDGNWRDTEGQPITGSFGPLIERFDNSRALVQMHRPSVIPNWLTLSAAAAVFGWVWYRARRVRPTGVHEARTTIVWTAFTLALVLLWSKAWSPQWQQLLVPLIILIRPDGAGVLLALSLAAVSFLEWPLMLSRGFAWAYWLTVPVRTALLVGWAVDLGRELIHAPSKAGS